MPIPFVITLVAVFATVALVSGSLASVVLTRTAPERRRLRKLTAPRRAAVAVEKLQLAETPSRLIASLSNVLPTSSRDRERLRRRLAAAGFDQYDAVVWYSTARFVLPVLLGILPLILVGISTGLPLAFFNAAVGIVLPDLVLVRRTAKIRKALQDGLPDALDLIVVCVEAGSSLDQAIVKAGNELEIALPAIARELKTVATEIRAGKPRMDAFQSFAKRTGVDDVRSLVAMLIQTDRFGTSIAQSLRTHADTSRTRRRQRAEHRASTIGVKLVFPLALCLMPALYVICLGPVVVAIYRNLF